MLSKDRAVLSMKTSCERCTAILRDTDDCVYICSYECTWCQQCAEDDFSLVCPNCQGDLARRPTRRPTAQPAP